MDWREYAVSPDITILQTMERINNLGSRFVLVVDTGDMLLGIATDGNIRRGLLKGLTLHDTVRAAMNPSPLTAAPFEDRQALLARMEDGGITHLPVVGQGGKLLGLLSRPELQAGLKFENPVVIMAGGLGSRLGELTKDCPKPMLHIGGKPLLEIVLRNYIDCGFSNFFIAVNYKAEQVEKYFSDGTKWGVTIQYLREEKRMGTAGALSLLPRGETHPVIVMNGDILTRLRGDVLIKTHTASDAVATMVVKPHEVQIPYGVVEYGEGNTLAGIREKPRVTFPVSAGINIFSPEALEQIPTASYLDMPVLYQRLLGAGMKVNIFEMDDYWLDIGHLVDYEKANSDFSQHFRDAQ